MRTRRLMNRGAVAIATSLSRRRNPIPRARSGSHEAKKAVLAKKFLELKAIVARLTAALTSRENYGWYRSFTTCPTCCRVGPDMLRLP
jgi:dienelactone hydrolase